MLSRKPTRRGFTLIEMLVVILIIGILVSLLLPALWYAVVQAGVAKQAFEVRALDESIAAYKTKYGDYPPDFSDVRAGVPFEQSVVYRHVRKSFQRIDAVEVNNLKIFAPTISNAEALVFWLGGLSANPKFPFSGAGGPLINTGTAQNPQLSWRTQDRHEPLYDFKPERLILETQGNAVVGASYRINNDETFPPYVYFESRTYSFVTNGKPTYASFEYPSPDGTGTTRVVPYKSTEANKSFNPNAPNGSKDYLFKDNELFFVNRDTFQIVCAGRDGEFGPLLGSGSPTYIYNDQNGNPVPLFTVFPTGRPYHPKLPSDQSYYDFFNGQQDNVASFTEGKTLEGSIP